MINHILLKHKFVGILLLYIFVFLCVFLSLHKSLFIDVSGEDYVVLFTYVYRFEWLEGGLKDISKTHAEIGMFWETCRFDNFQKYFGSFFSPSGLRRYTEGAIYEIFGLFSFPYYLISMFLKSFAAMSLFFLTKKLTNNKAAGIISCALFAVGYIGIQGTDYVFNMTVFFSLIFFSLFLFFYFPFNREEDRAKSYFSHYRSSKYFLSVFFFTIIVISEPKRFWFLPAIVLLIDVLGFFRGKYSKQVASALVRQIPLFFIFVIYQYRTMPASNNDYFMTQLWESLKQIDNVIFHLFTTMGNIVIPYPAYNYLSSWVLPLPLYSNSPVEKISSLSYIALLFIAVSGLFKIFHRHLFHSLIIPFLVAGLVGLVLGYKWAAVPTVETVRVGLTMIGLLFSISTITIVFKIRTEKRALCDFILVMLVLMVVSYLPMYINQGNYNSWYCSYHHYLILSSFAFIVILGLLLSLFEYDTWQLNKIVKIIALATIVGSLIIMNILCSRSFMERLLKHRSYNDTAQIWQTIKQEVPDIKSDNILFYFTADDAEDIDAMVAFGWPLRMGLAFNEPDIARFYNPYVFTNFDQLVKKTNEMGMEGLHSFHLTKTHKLLNTTEETRKKLVEISMPVNEVSDVND